MSFVLDSSVALAWVLPDESSAEADLLMGRLTEIRAVVPSLWPLEVGNALLMASRRARIDSTKIKNLLAVLYALPIDFDASPDRESSMRTMSLAEQQDLTTYDASYLELAIRRKLPLATFDSRLKAASAAVGVSLLT